MSLKEVLAVYCTWAEEYCGALTESSWLQQQTTTPVIVVLVYQSQCCISYSIVLWSRDFKILSHYVLWVDQWILTPIFQPDVLETEVVPQKDEYEAYVSPLREHHHATGDVLGMDAPPMLEQPPFAIEWGK